MRLQQTILFTLLVTATFWSVTSAIAQIAQEDPVDLDALQTEERLDEGRQVYVVHCARCHGMRGEGGEGPSFKRPHLRYAPDDESLLNVISNGIPGTGMPGVFAPNPSEMQSVAAYVRSLGRLADEALPGNPDNGRLVYENKGACSTCHIINGHGRGVGPELSDVGLRRNSAYLRQALADPDADFPKSFSWIDGARNAFLTVRVVAEEGEFEGLRINEDEFSIQMRDLSGQVRSFDKRNLLNFTQAPGHSLMPGYDTTFNDTETNDLVAYLMSLRGASKENDS